MPNGGEHGDSSGRGRSVEAFKRTFFDPRAVLDPEERAIQRALSKLGAYIRQRARTSIRYRDKPSAPGSPPSAHRTMIRLRPLKKGRPPGGPKKRQASSPLRDFLFFGYEKEDETVVVGPAKTNQSNKFARPTAGTVPQVEEEGGQVSVMEARLGGRWVGAAGVRPRRLAGAQTRWRTVTIGARPYMVPARDAELPKFMDSLKGSIKAG